MGRNIIIALLLIASLGYATYTYWPLLAPYLPAGQVGQPTKPPAAAPNPVIVPALPEAASKAPTKETAEMEIEVPTEEVNLIDPFALRVEVKTRAEEPLPPPAFPQPGGPERPTVKPAELKLEGVWINSGMRIAFISGQALPIGGKIMGYRVMAIDKENVVLQKGAATKTLRLEEKL